MPPRLDVSVKETSDCIVDDTGKIIREVKVASEPEKREPVRDIDIAAVDGPESA